MLPRALFATMRQMYTPPTRVLVFLAGGALVVALVALGGMRFSRNAPAPLLLQLTATPAGDARGTRVFEIKKIEFFDERRGWQRGIASPLTLTAPSNTAGMATRILRLPPGTYRQVRMEFGKRFDAAAESAAPPFFSPVVLLPLTLTIQDQKAVLLSLTLDTNASLRTTVEGEEIVVPIITAEVREGILLSKKKEVSGGTITLNQVFGMTPSGRMRPRYRLPANASIVRRNGAYVLRKDEDMIARRFLQTATSSEEVKSAGDGSATSTATSSLPAAA